MPSSILPEDHATRLPKVLMLRNALYHREDHFISRHILLVCHKQAFARETFPENRGQQETSMLRVPLGHPSSQWI